MTPIPTTDLPLDEIKLGSPEVWARKDRAGIFAKLRAERPVSFHAEPEFIGFPAGPGFWSLTRYADVVRASRDSETFISGKGSNIGDLPIELLEFFGSMINMDAPRHTKLRKLVNRGFTPRMVASLEESVRATTRRIVDAVAPKGSCNFVEEIAAPLPLKIICDMMGIPEADNRRMFELSNTILGIGDPEFGVTMDVLMAAAIELSQYAQALGEERAAKAREDITSVLMTADVDGDRLTTAEFASFFILLVVAGNETTRNAISHGMKALTDFPDERRKWMADFDGVAPTAVEEIVRWATPVIHFRRTTTRDVELSGQKIREGEKVVLWYTSANRDEAAFTDPYRFDVTRTPNEHVGFGGGGAHYCLGANLARQEIRVMFQELFRTLPDIHVVGEPDMLFSGFIHGIKRMRVEWKPR
ncbi:MAG TPA: cytochrome P450 [Candidatus Eisenbacteria bacterium]|nr:cytochrome P450 [Candidatus Eisenbacteria bacterium]